MLLLPTALALFLHSGWLRVDGLCCLNYKAEVDAAQSWQTIPIGYRNVHQPEESRAEKIASASVLQSLHTHLCFEGTVHDEANLYHRNNK